MTPDPLEQAAEEWRNENAQFWTWTDDQVAAFARSPAVRRELLKEIAPAVEHADWVATDGYGNRDPKGQFLTHKDHVRDRRRTRMQAIHCDRCRAVAVLGGNGSRPDKWLVLNIDRQGIVEGVSDKELCPKCAKALSDWLKPLPVGATI